jgi:hypothetical protein
MREFFLGWKRKIGAGTLTIACALIAIGIIALVTRWSQGIIAPNGVSERLANSRQKEVFASTKKLIALENTLEAHLRETIYFQGPVAVNVAWRKPTFLFLHVEKWHVNPEIWFWFEDQQLVIYEESPNRGAHGVRITNLVSLTGDNAEKAFAIVIEKSKAFAYVGGIGIALLRLFAEADIERLEVFDENRQWRYSAFEDHFSNEILSPFTSGTDDRLKVSFLLPQSPDQSLPIAKIRISYEPVKPDSAKTVPEAAGVVAEIVSLQNEISMERLRFPKPPKGSIVTRELNDIGELNVDLIDVVRFIPLTE